MDGGFDTALDEHLERGFAGMRAVHAIVAGRVDRATLTRWAARYYAELRCFLDVKLPERMRLCPYDAHDAKALFAEAYAEEQGRFRPGEDHASLFGRLCTALGLGRDALEAETARYALGLAPLRAAEPSRAMLVRELAITCAWENAAPLVGGALAEALARHYGIGEGALGFFVLHERVDRVHGAAARRVLARHVDTPALARLALATVDEALHVQPLLDGTP